MDAHLREALQAVGRPVEVEKVLVACRLCRTPEGLGGAPSVEQLVEVLSRR